MKTVRIRLQCPHEGVGNPAMDQTMSSGGGFRWVDATYSVNPVGSKNLYRLTKVERNGEAIALDAMNRLNPPDAIDEAIGKTFEAYAKEHQGITVKKKKAAPKKVLVEDVGQATIPDL